MRKNYNNLFFLSLILTLSIFILTWCQKENNEIQTNNESETISENNQNKKDLDINKQFSETKTLTINNKCIGCRKCTIIAPNNFEMNWPKAEVISQENVNKMYIQNAISRCPVDAIELIEA